MLKIVGIIMIITTTSLVGIIFSKKLSDRVKKLTLIKLMLEELAIQIRFQASTVFELVNSLCENFQLNELEFLPLIKQNFEPNKSFDKAWINGIDSWKENSFCEEDIKFLKNIGLTLGESDIDGQLSTIELHKENLNQMINDAILQRDKKAKLYRSLGVLSGAFISIILL